MRSTFAALALAATTAAAAETTTLDIFLPMATDVSLAGSIVNVDSSLTTLAVGCPSDGADKHCTSNFPVTQTVVQGTSTWILHYPLIGYTTATPEPTETLGCTLDYDKDLAECQASDVYRNGVTASTTSHTVSWSLSESILPVTITAGAEKLSVDASATGSTPAITGTTTTESDSTLTSAATTTGTQTSADGDNPAGPKATVNALLAGAAVLAGGVMAL